MYKQKIGISVGSSKTKEFLQMLKDIGFDAIAPSVGTDENLEKTISTARDLGLEVEFIHANFGEAAKMWSDKEEEAALGKNEILTALESCRKFGVKKLVVHVWIGFDYTFGETKHGFKNFGEIVSKAKEYGVKICFENTEGEEYLYALMEHFKDDDTVGFCWDNGHEMCYNHSMDLLKNFGDRLLITHLNDNLGISRYDGKTYWTDDLHLLPYDGIADWDYNIERLRKSRKLDILNFELNIESKPNRHENDLYGKMTPEEYFTEVYKRACKIAYRYSK